MRSRASLGAEREERVEGGVAGTGSLPRLKREVVLARIAEAEDLPTISPIVSKIIDMSSGDRATATDVGEVIKGDAALSLKILKLVNSAFYGLNRKVDTISQAVVILGMNTIRNVALSVSILNAFPPKETKQFDYLAFWERSLRRGVTAKLLAQRTGARRVEEALLCGLVADLGILILVQFYPDHYQHVVETARYTSRDLIELERDLFGTDHTEAGRIVARRWRLPESIAASIEAHHRGNFETVEEDHRPLVQLAAVGERVAELYDRSDKHGLILGVRELALTALGVDEAALDEVLGQVSEQVREAAGFFGLKVGEQKSLTDVLLAANKELGKLNLTYDQMNRELQAAIKRAEELAEKLREANKRLEEMAHTDALTGIYNRRYFYDCYQREVSRSQRYELPLSIVMIDIDYFKKFNDNYGHQVGDYVLRDIAQLIAARIRKSDLVARYGGEEFVVILTQTNAAGAKIFAERIRKVIEDKSFEQFDYKFRVTISLGGCTYPLATSLVSPDDLIRVADAALYKSKRDGRNRVTWAS